MKELPLYQCHKVVRAGKISAIENPTGDSNGNRLLHIGDGVETLCVKVDAAYMAKHNPQVGGYFVEYEDGYQSFSPADAFEGGYSRVTTDTMTDMHIGRALAWLRLGKRVRRAGWNGKGMWIALMPGLKLPPFSSQEPGAKVNDRTAKFIGPDTPLDSQPYIAMWTAQQKWQPGWLCSQNDLLAIDWEVVPD